ncbi:MAG: sugar ABC transporter permease [Ancalomicrobiaceae bacterium]|nr:sugar ABC transporter permease [Ancalomicrobiaceae bacterium]
MAAVRQSYRDDKRQKAIRQAGRVGRLNPLLFLAPAGLALLAVSVFPVFDGLWLSMHNTLLSAQRSDFIGLGNYWQLVGDDQFWSAWQHTLVFTAVSTIAETLIGLAMALVLHETFSGRGMVRAAMLIPWAIPTVVTSKMFGWLFDGQHGIVNWLLVQTHILSGPANWYGSTDTAFWTIVIADVWKTAPFMALLLLAGLQTVPGALIEASRMDGAGALQTFFYIRLPLLLPTLMIAGMFRALDAFRIFDLVYVLTGGGPADSTEVLSTLTYKTLFSALDFGYGSALSVAMFATEALVAFGFGLFIMRGMRRANG